MQDTQCIPAAPLTSPARCPQSLQLVCQVHPQQAAGAIVTEVRGARSAIKPPEILNILWGNQRGDTLEHRLAHPQARGEPFDVLDLTQVLQPTLPAGQHTRCNPRFAAQLAQSLA